MPDYKIIFNKSKADMPVGDSQLVFSDDGMFVDFEGERTNVTNFTPLPSFTTHTTTDRARWQDYYTTKENVLALEGNYQGFTMNIDGMEYITLTPGDAAYTPTNDFGGIIVFVYTNADGAFTTISVDGSEKYSTEGIVDGVSVNDSMLVEVKDVGKEYMLTHISMAYYIPFMEDKDSRVMNKIIQLENQVAALSTTVNNLNASMQAKMLDESAKIDIEASTQATGGWEVPSNNGLGGRIDYEAIDFLLGSSGTITIDGEVVYDYAGLLGLKVGTPSGNMDVMDGQVIETSGLNSIFYTPYVPKLG